MPKIRVYDPAMCCSTGVCGPTIDPALVRFSADADWAKGQKIELVRYNLSQEPMAFVNNPVVKQFFGSFWRRSIAADLGGRGDRPGRALSDP